MTKSAVLVVATTMLPAAFVGATSYHGKAWQAAPDGSLTFPEQDWLKYPEINLKPNTGIVFSSGGSRAYLGSFGVLAGLHELALMQKIRYMTGVSGGNWATVAYSYQNLTGVTDDDFLGPVIPPANLTLDNLGSFTPNSGRAGATFPFANFPKNPATAGTIFEQWVENVAAAYLTPLGIPRHVPFSYDAASVADIKRRNPSLASTEFQIVKPAGAGVDHRPYPIVATSLQAPTNALPVPLFDPIYNLLEIAPLSVGVAVTAQFNYTTAAGGVVQTVGGLAEPFTFGLESTIASTGLPSGKKSGSIYVGDTTIPPSFDIVTGASSSSYSPGKGFAETPSQNNGIFLDELNYWSPSVSGNHTGFTASFEDGSGVVNDNIISLLQRGVERIIVCSISNTPLNASWVPVLDAASGNVTNYNIGSFDYSVASLFGQVPLEITHVLENNLPLSTLPFSATNYLPNQLFRKADFYSLVKSLQALQAVGESTVVRQTLRTVANAKFGIKANKEVEVLWVYFSASSVWTNQLSPDVQAALSAPILANFPNVGTLFANYNTTQANLFANFGGWLVTHNAQLFTDFLSCFSLRH